jgi:hypothetical protein
VQAGASIDVAETSQLDDPLMPSSGIRSDLSGAVFAVGDARSVQTAVVRTDQDDAVFSPDYRLGSLTRSP